MSGCGNQEQIHPNRDFFTALTRQFFIGVAFKHKFSRYEIRNHDAVYVQAILVAEEEAVG